MATLLVASVTLAALVIVLRCQRAAALFSNAEMGHVPIGPLSSAKEFVNNGCPRGVHGIRKDLTIHFLREMPASQFDGTIEIVDEAGGREVVLYRGDYSPIITIAGVCYDGAHPGRDALELKIVLITEHHEYFFHTDAPLPLGLYSDAEIMLWVYGNFLSRADLRPVRAI